MADRYAELTDDDLRVAYKAYSDQIAREDTLYQNRVNYLLLANGSIMVFYASIFNGRMEGHGFARFFFLMVICMCGFGATTVFERLIDRGFRHLQAMKTEFRKYLGEYARSRLLPMPSMPVDGYVVYPVSELSMWMYFLWSVITLMSVLIGWGGAVESING